MGFRFRKSIRLGGGFKINLSKSGVGYSWGTKGIRFTKTATGKNRTTLSIPGTGISYVSESGNQPERTQKNAGGSGDKPRTTPVKRVLLWILTVFMALTAIVYLPHVSGILALVAAVLALPLNKWQAFLSHFLKGNWRRILLTVTAIAAVLSAPESDSPDAASVPTNESVEVTEAETIPPVDRIIFLEETVSVGIGRTVELPFTLSPEQGDDHGAEISVAHPEIAEATLDGHIVLLTGLTPGNVTITLRIGEVSATATVTVTEVLPQEIQITPEPQSPEVGMSGRFTATFTPTDVTDPTVQWHSDAPEILQIHEDGTFEALAVGEATITASHETGVVGVLRVEVLPIQVETITLRSDLESDTPFYTHDSMHLTAQITPEDAADQTLTWFSDDESVATVSDTGIVTAISSGTAVIKAESSNGKTGYYTVTVSASPQKFRISASISLQSNDHVGNRWTTGFQFNDEPFYSGNIVSIVPGETFSVCGWAQDNDSNPDYGSYLVNLTLTEEMCQSGFTVEGEATVRENGGRYSGNCAVWYVKLVFTPIS